MIDRSKLKAVLNVYLKYFSKLTGKTWMKNLYFSVRKLSTTSVTGSVNYPKHMKLDFFKKVINTILRLLIDFLQCLDASRSWICYWTLHALELLDVTVTEETKTAVISFLNM